MPTEPLQAIIYRGLAIENARPLISVAGPLLRELVNYGSNALVRCATSTDSGPDQDHSPLALYRHIIEATDAIEVLVSQACASAAIPLVRSAFEALISLEYVIASTSLYAQRSLSWLVGYIHQRLNMYLMLDQQTPSGQEFARSLDADRFVRDLALPVEGEARKAYSNLARFLERPHIAPIESEFKRLRGKKLWFRLYEGPNDLRELAHEVGHAAWYDFMYRYWSRVSHAQDFAAFIAKTPNGESTIRPIRHPQELKSVASFTASVALEATRRMIGRFRNGEDIRPWYIRDVRPLYIQVFSRADAA